MKISSYIFFSFLFALLLFSITTFINFKLSREVNENAEYVSRSTEITKNGTRFQRNILTMVSGLRGYLLTGERYFIESYDEAVKENETILQELSAIITDTSQVVKTLNSLVIEMELRYDLLKKAFHVEKQRKATKPGKGAVEERIKEKKVRATVKSTRKKTFDLE